MMSMQAAITEAVSFIILLIGVVLTVFTDVRFSKVWLKGR